MATTKAAPVTELPPRTLNSVLSILLAGYPNPEDPPSPGPWDPVIRTVLERLGPHPEPWKSRFNTNVAALRLIAKKFPAIWDTIGGGRFDAVALNPQPLPPREAFLVEFARAAADRLALIQETADLIGSNGDRQGIIVVGGRVSELVDEFCGTGWPKKFPPKPPGPDPDPRFSATELILAASRFLTAAGGVANPQLADELNRAGERLMDEAVNRA
jgi:hypothetical protein